MKIFLGVEEISGILSSLQQGFLKLGYDCTFISKKEHPFRYNDENRFYVKLIHFFSKQASSASKNNCGKFFWYALREILMFFLFVFAITKYDVFIFIFNSTFLTKQIDLPFLKLFNKKIILIYVGSDARPPYLDGAIMAQDIGKNIKQCIELARKTKKKISWAEKYANYLINYPPTGYFHEKKFILGLIVGLPKEIKQNCYSLQYENIGVENKSYILHSPSHPEAKGTPVIRAAIKSLKEKGHDIEFIEIIGQPNTVVLDQLARCDFVIDQIYSDTPLAGFATEAAFFSKPAVVGGYYVGQVHRDAPSWCVPPSEYVHPDHIEQAIEKLITDKHYRINLGKQAKQFAETYLKPEKVASRYLKLIEDSVPEQWYYDPYNIEYLHGACLSEQRVKDLIRGVVKLGGEEALQLADKPKLKRMLLAFARVE